MSGEKYISKLNQILLNTLANQMFQRTPRVIVANFHKMNFMKVNVILAKSNQM